MNKENLSFQKVSMHLYLAPERKAARKEWEEKMYLKMLFSEKENEDPFIELKKTEDDSILPWFTAQEDVKENDWYVFD